MVLMPQTYPLPDPGIVLPFPLAAWQLRDFSSPHSSYAGPNRFAQFWPLYLSGPLQSLLAAGGDNTDLLSVIFKHQGHTSKVLLYQSVPIQCQLAPGDENTDFVEQLTNLSNN